MLISSTTPTLLLASVFTLSVNAYAAPRISVKADESAARSNQEDTAVSDPMATKLIDRANKGLTKKQVCEDYELALHLLALIQAPQGRRGDNTTAQKLAEDIRHCPDTYAEVAKEIRKRQTALSDFHTAFAAPGLKYSSSPVVTGCSDQTLCGGFVGSLLQPLRTEAADAAGQKLYAFAADQELNPHILAIESVNNLSARQLFNNVAESKILSTTKQGNNVEAIGAILNRHILDNRDRPDMSIVVRRISDNSRFTIQTSFAAEPTIDSSFLTSLSRDYSVAHSYGCVDTEPESTLPFNGVGACVNKDGQAIVWITTFSMWDASGAQVHPFPEKVAQSLLQRRPDAAAKPVLLDVRGNGGGSPAVATNFACTFGGDKALAVMKKRRLVTSMFPESITLSSGTVINMQEFANPDKMGNGDLVKFIPNWNVSSAAPDATRHDYNVGLFERFEMTDADCLAMRDPTLANTKWLILTDGREFSATENFISFLEKSKNFTKIGSNTWGGTGAPTIFTLPNSGMLLRLSLARHVAGDAGDSQAEQFPIEAVGVKTDNPQLRDLPADFEKRLLASLAGAEDIDDSIYAPYLIRRAAQYRP